MKVCGIVFLVLAVLNFVVAILAAGSGAGDAAGSKFSAAVMLGIIGGVLFYLGNKKKSNQDKS